jgi:hypothetical protein
VPSGVQDPLAPLQFGGTTAVTQSTSINIAGSQIQLVAALHTRSYVFEISYFCVDKNSCTILKQKVMIPRELITNIFKE